MTKPLLLFLLLQLMDFATTTVALAMGGTERNPFIGEFMALGPISGLIVSKLIVIGLAVVVVLIHKHKAIRWANIAFSLIVAWNLTIIGRLIFSG